MKKSKECLYEFHKDDNTKLEHLPWNRKVTLRRDLIESIQKNGFITTIIIIITDIIDGVKRAYITDGQHRTMAAFELGIPVVARVIEKEFKSVGEFVKHVAMMNSTQKPWATADYIRTFATLGYDDYKILQRLHSKYSFFSAVTIALMLYGFTTRSTGTISRLLRNGTFNIKYYDAAKYSLALASKLIKYQKLTNRMVLALHYVANMKDFNEEIFIENYKQNAERIKELQLDDYTDIFSGWRK